MRPTSSHPDNNSESVKPVWLRSIWPRTQTAAGPPEALLVFSSERERLQQLEAPPPTPTPAAQPAKSRRRLAGRDVVIGLLALVAIAEAGVIGAWIVYGRTSAPVDGGSVVVTSVPVGAPVSVNDVSRGVTPFRASLLPGTYRITVGHGASSWSQSVAVAERGEASVHVQLQDDPPPTTSAALRTGTLQITTDPPGAKVLVDDEPRGVTPLTLTDVAPGVHTVSLSNAAGSQTKSVAVVEGAASTLVVSLNSPSGVASGWLAISSPIPAEIREGGTLVGNTEMPRIMLPAGDHDLEFRNSSLDFRLQRTVRITAGKTTSLGVEVPNGSVAINAMPWAEVSVGRRSLGETPIGNVSLPIGTHELVFRHPQLGERRATVVVKAGSPVRVGIDLRKAQP